MTALYRDIELPLMPVLADMEAAGVKVDIYRLAEIAAKLATRSTSSRSAPTSSPAARSRSARPSSWARCCSSGWGCPPTARARPATPPTPACWPRSATSTRSSTWSRPGASSPSCSTPTCEPLPGLVDPATAACTPPSARRPPPPAGCRSIRPNLQNIPIRTPLGREIRGAFVAEDGYRLLSADYSQVELRILAHLSGEPALKDAFARGEDIHRATAAEVLGKPAEELTSTSETAPRRSTSASSTASARSACPSSWASRGRRRRASSTSTWPGSRRSTSSCSSVIAQAKEDGYVTTLFGRRRPIPELRASNYQTRSLGERLAVNTVMQGSAADIIKVAMIGCHRRLRDAGLRVAAGAADPRRAAVRGRRGRGGGAARAMVREEMTGAYPLDPPLDIDIGVGATWLDAK